jgi:CheY-like chemotaxis protein
MTVLDSEERLNSSPITSDGNHAEQRCISICIVDDDPIINFVTRKTIEKNFSQIRLKEFTSPVQALRQLKSGEYIPDVLFLDLNMPELDGWQMLDELSKESGQPIDVYILSSSIDPKDRTRSENYEMVKDFFSKPISIDQLDQVLANAAR